MGLIDMKTFLAIAGEDFEFNREMRYFGGRIKLEVGEDEAHVMEFENGRLVKVSDTSVADASCKIFVKGTRDQWSELIKLYPRPFFQSIQSSCVMHGMAMSDSNESFAYLPALNRIIQILRNTHNQE
jgi:hypothetical protein